MVESSKLMHSQLIKFPIGVYCIFCIYLEVDSLISTIGMSFSNLVSKKNNTQTTILSTSAHIGLEQLLNH